MSKMPTETRLMLIHGNTHIPRLISVQKVEAV